MDGICGSDDARCGVATSCLILASDVVFKYRGMWLSINRAFCLLVLSL